MRYLYPSIEDYDGDYEAYADACEAYDDYESDLEDLSMERYYSNKYGI